MQMYRNDNVFQSITKKAALITSKRLKILSSCLFVHFAVNKKQRNLRNQRQKNLCELCLPGVALAKPGALCGYT